MPASKRKAHVETRTVGKLWDPIITVSDIPADVDVGDKIIPKVKVEKQVGVPIVGVSVDFFVEDSLQVSTLGTRQATDVNGEATASEGYYIGEPESEQTIYFIIQVHKKKPV
jgi:hypothetical protein